ncbi:MAG: TonB-dependent receptor [Pseudomonadota bacterium]
MYISRSYISAFYAPFLLSSILFCNPTFSQDNGLSADYFFEDLPVVLSATRLSQPVSDIPAAMTIIDREMIEASGVMSIPDLLRIVPGMTVGFYSGSRATVSYHGMADQYARDMQVLIDGRSIYDPGYGGVSWPDMPIELDEISRIEVVRGPNAAAYGSNSYAGVINIITEHPADQLGTTIKTILGEGERRKLYGRYADIDDDVAYRISANYQEQDGFDSIPDDERTRWFSFHGDYTPDDQNNFHAMLGASEGTYEEGFNEIAQTVRELDNTYNYQQLRWEHQASPSNRIELQFYHNFLEIEDNFQSSALSDLIKNWEGWETLNLEPFYPFPVPVDDRPDALAQYLSFDEETGLPVYWDYASLLSALNMTDSPLAASWLGFKSHRYDLEMQQTLTPMDSLRLVWGLGFRQDSVEGLWIFHQDETITRDQSRIFGNIEWRMTPDLVTNIGGMLEKFEKKDPLFSPRLALNYHLNEHNTLRASASRAYRMPTLYEDYVNLVVFLDGPLNDLNTRRIATENLEPQKIDSYELGYFGNFPDYDLTLDLRFFYEKLENIIDEYRNLDLSNPDRGLTDPTALAVLDRLNDAIHEGAFTYSNEAEARIRGVEVNIHYKPTPADLLFLGYSYLDTDGTHLAEIKDGEKRFNDVISENVPDHTFSILGSHRFDNGFQISSAYYFMDDMNWPGEGDEVPSYNRWDIRLAKHFDYVGLDAEVALFLQNAGGDNTDFFEDEETGQINVWERRAFLQAKINFH